METIILILIFGGALIIAARYIKKTLTDGEMCQTCDKDKSSCDSKNKEKE